MGTNRNITGKGVQILLHVFLYNIIIYLCKISLRSWPSERDERASERIEECEEARDERASERIEEFFCSLFHLFQRACYAGYAIIHQRTVILSLFL